MYQSINNHFTAIVIVLELSDVIGATSDQKTTYSEFVTNSATQKSVYTQDLVTIYMRDGMSITSYIVCSLIGGVVVICTASASLALVLILRRKCVKSQKPKLDHAITDRYLSDSVNNRVDVSENTYEIKNRLYESRSIILCEQIYCNVPSIEITTQ